MTVIPFPTPPDPAEALAQDVARKMWALLVRTMLDEIDTGDAENNRQAEVNLTMRSLELLLLIVAQDIEAQTDPNPPRQVAVCENFNMLVDILQESGRRRSREARRRTSQ